VISVLSIVQNCHPTSQSLLLLVYIALHLPTFHMNQRRASSRKENIPVRQEPSVSAPPATISVIRTNSGFPSKSFSSMLATSNAGSFSGYLARPLEALRVSLDDSVAERITLHDLAETYNLVCERLKKLIFIGLDSEQGAMALESIRTSNSVLTKALLRDISRLLSHPFSSADESQMDVDFEMQDALDSASVGQHATRVLSEIVAFPALHSLFSCKGYSLKPYFFILTLL